MCFPKEAWRRVVIIVLDEHRYEQCLFEPEGAHLLVHDKMYGLRFPTESTHPVVQKLKARELLRPGKMLVQSPFDSDAYEDVSIAAERFAVKKYMLFSTLCRLLGAKRVRVVRVEIQETSKISTFEFEHDHLGGRFIKPQKPFESLIKQIEVDDEFEGGPANVTAAKQFLEQHSLDGEPTLKELVGMRTGSANPLKRHRLTMNLFHESQDKLNIAATINIPPFIQIDASYDRTLMETTRFSVTFEVEFNNDWHEAVSILPVRSDP